MIVALLLSTAPMHAVPTLPEDYRRLECRFDGIGSAFLLDMPTPAFLRRYRGDNAVLYALATDADSTLDGVRFQEVEDRWPEKLSGEWTDGNASVHRFDVGPFELATKTAPFALKWDSTPRHARVNWVETEGTCTLVHEDTE